MSARLLLAIGVMAAWGVGIAALARREMSRSPRERLAEAAIRVSPGATYFAVERDDDHIGFASTTIDTLLSGLQVTDYFVADLDAGGTTRRATAQSVVRLSRTLALRDFAITVGGQNATPVRASGRMVGDSILEYVVDRDGARGDTVRARLSGPLLLPTLVPLVVALGRTRKIGTTYAVDTFDPTTMTMRAIGVSIRAESLFVLVDSAAFDSTAGRWQSAHADTVRGWNIVADSGAALDSWVDELGQIIAVRGPAGLALRRTAYEMAFENWRAGSAIRRDRNARPLPPRPLR